MKLLRQFRQGFDFKLWLEVGALTAMFTILRPVQEALFQQGFSMLFPSWMNHEWLLVHDLATTKPYQQPFILGSALSQPLFLIMFLGCLAIPLGGWKLLGWRRLIPDTADRRSMRLFLTGLTCVIAWVYATYGVNWYYGHIHGLDRGLILAFAACVWLHPAMLAPFLLQTFLVMSQMYAPIEGLSTTKDALPLNALLMSCAFLHLVVLVRIPIARLYFAAAYGVAALALPDAMLPLTKWGPLAAFILLSVHVLEHYKIRPGVDRWIFTLVCLTAAHYVSAGLAKITISPHFYEWMWFNQVADLTAFRMSDGWLGFLPDHVRANFLALLRDTAVMGQILVLTIELGALFILWRRRTVPWFLMAFVGLHLAIFITCGVFFWAWILFDLALAWMLKNREELLPGGWSAACLSVLIMATGHLTIRAPQLGWFDTPLSYGVTVEGKIEDGEYQTLRPIHFAPYITHFEVAASLYVFDAPLLVYPFGVKSYGLANAMHQAGPGQIASLERARGVRFYRRNRADTLDHYLRTWFRNRRQDSSAAKILGWIGAPKALWLSPPSDAWDGRDTPTHLRLRFTKRYYDGRVIHILDDRIIHELELTSLTQAQRSGDPGR